MAANADDHAYRTVNRRAWDTLARSGSDSSIPVTPEQLAEPERWLDGYGTIPWGEVHTVLCLGAGGGQQGPLLAALGRRVTVADISPEQLRRDDEVASEHGLELETVRLDMLDLSPLHGRDFDLVYQPISSLYVPDAARLYRQVAAVLRPRGLYRVEHVNPIHLQIAEDNAWDGDGYRLTRRPGGGQPVSWSHEVDGDALTCWHYVHSLDDLIGSLCDAGFVVLAFRERSAGDPAAEPGTLPHLAAYAPTFFWVLARRRAT